MCTIAVVLSNATACEPNRCQNLEHLNSGQLKVKQIFAEKSMKILTL